MFAGLEWTVIAAIMLLAVIGLLMGLFVRELWYAWQRHLNYTRLQNRLKTEQTVRKMQH